MEQVKSRGFHKWTKTQHMVARPRSTDHSFTAKAEKPTERRHYFCYGEGLTDETFRTAPKETQNFLG